MTNYYNLLNEKTPDPRLSGVKCTLFLKNAPLLRKALGTFSERTYGFLSSTLPNEIGCTVSLIRPSSFPMIFKSYERLVTDVTGIAQNPILLEPPNVLFVTNASIIRLSVSSSTLYC